MVKLSAPRTGRLYSQEIPLILISVRDRVDPSAIVLLAGLSMKNSSDKTGNRSHRQVLNFVLERHVKKCGKSQSPTERPAPEM
jgi:hypothetical protein